MLRIATIAILAATLNSPAWAGETPSPPDANVYFINLKDGDTVQNPVLIQFGLVGMGVAPAGVEKPDTGHHHLLIDAQPPAGEELDYPLPADGQHKHFGGGKTQVTMDLPKGTHALQLLLGDLNHIPHNPPVMSGRIMVTVE